ncbi:hypothetical protein BCV70DRAFT_203180 [Testicularia cyperi]|uniref:Zn(2)-C6 fungal-type domain-containing protein n=1 Tax=Testicularia cyperi TaxID=1882483 RepID=A0A317XIJ8_9BASI|nr:hypothetical protein BCV70DRAFT_203180 [Testicularia cyperi]
MSTDMPTGGSDADIQLANESNQSVTPEKSNNNDDDQDKPKRAQTCFRCRQSKVKCVFEDNKPSCRRCIRLGVSCELQGKREPLSWQMRVQNQLAALEGSLQAFLDKQGGPSGGDAFAEASRRLAGPRPPRDSYPSSSDLRNGDLEAPKKRRKTFTADGRSDSHRNTPGSSGSHHHSHQHVAGSPLYTNHTSADGAGYAFSPQGSERHRDHPSVLGALSGGQGYSSGDANGALAGGGGDDVIHDGAASSGQGRSAFHTEDEHDLASRPLASIQKLRMSVLDRKKEVSRSGERVFPNLYRMATSDVGSKDPRPNVIKQELVSPQDAVVLFRFFAEYLDQYSFGFPTYRPDAIMSPMILASVVSIASLHHAQLNRLHGPLKGDLIARLQTDDHSFPCSDVYETLFSSSLSGNSKLQSNLQFEKELDPELGIGVEEIVGASLFACWFGGKRAWMASRLARWWSAKFLRQQQHPAMMTMGEIMSILPPPRDLGKQDLLRVWLSAYITEIHQACMEGTPSIAGLSSPHAVNDSLQYSRGLSQRTTLRDRILIMHAKIAWIVSKAYHTAGAGASEQSKSDKQAADKASPSRSCNSCRDGGHVDTSATAGRSGSGTAGANDATACLQAILDAFDELDSCQEEMAGKLDPDAISEPESMLYLDLFLARVLIASIGCDFLDSTLWDGSLGQLSGSRNSRGKNMAETDLQDLRNRTLRESLTRGVEGAMRSLELVCLPTTSSPGRHDGRGSIEMAINVLVLPVWFHWALTRSVLFLMNVLAEYPERLLPRDRSRSADLINMFLDIYSKHIGHANMVLSHGASRSTGEPAYPGGNAWSPNDGDLAPRDSRSSRPTNNGIPTSTATAGSITAPSNWQASSTETVQHPATPLLDTLNQCLTWARHGAVL